MSNLGYKMCSRIYLNGDGIGKETPVKSVSCCRGEKNHCKESLEIKYNSFGIFFKASGVIQ